MTVLVYVNTSEQVFAFRKAKWSTSVTGGPWLSELISPAGTSRSDQCRDAAVRQPPDASLESGTIT